MNPNRFLGITSFGESHGPMMGVVIEDIKPGIDFPHQELRILLDKRKPGTGEFDSPRKENDDYQVVSGLFNGKTTGMPICILFPNRDARSEDYERLRDVFRPGHADFTLFKKFKIHDYRGGGHLSGRETIARVAASALVTDETSGIIVTATTERIGELAANEPSGKGDNEFHWPDAETLPSLRDYIRAIKAGGDSVGGVLRMEINGVPSGLGDPVFEKLDANLSKALLSIGGVKGIEFGDGFLLGGMKGSQANDRMTVEGFTSNHCGGILGGISTGKPVVLRIAIKPVPSIGLPQQTLRHDGSETILTHTSRSDVCLIPRIIPVCEAMIRLTLADALAYQRLIEGAETKIDDLRGAIDRIDEDILNALHRRDRIVDAIALLKREKNMPVRDSAREKELMQRLLQKADAWNLDKKLVNRLWDAIMEHSRRRQ